MPLTLASATQGAVTSAAAATGSLTVAAEYAEPFGGPGAYPDIAFPGLVYPSQPAEIADIATSTALTLTPA